MTNIRSATWLFAVGAIVFPVMACAVDGARTEESVGARRAALEGGCANVWITVNPESCDGASPQMPSDDRMAELNPAGVRVIVPAPRRAPEPGIEVPPAEQPCPGERAGPDPRVAGLGSLPSMAGRSILGVITLASLGVHDGRVPTPEELGAAVTSLLERYRAAGARFDMIQILNESDGGFETIPADRIGPLFVAGANAAHAVLGPSTPVITPGFTGGAAHDPIGAIRHLLQQPGVIGAADLVGYHAYTQTGAALGDGLAAVEAEIEAQHGAQRVAITETNEQWDASDACHQGEFLFDQFRTAARDPNVAFVTVYDNDRGVEEGDVGGMHLYGDDGGQRSGGWVVGAETHCRHLDDNPLGADGPGDYVCGPWRDPPTPGACFGCRRGGELRCGPGVDDGCGGTIDCPTSCPGTMTCGADGHPQLCVTDCFGECYSHPSSDQELTCCHWGCMCRNGDPGGLAWPCGLVNEFFHCGW